MSRPVAASVFVIVVFQKFLLKKVSSLRHGNVINLNDDEFNTPCPIRDTLRFWHDYSIINHGSQLHRRAATGKWSSFRSLTTFSLVNSIHGWFFFVAARQCDKPTP
jgi:hypothetical protein